MYNSKKSILTGIFLMSLTLIFPLVLIAQSTCKVLIPAINLTYEGQCKNGLADGKGNARGTDHYSGNFKKGLPDGEGKYTWQNGNSYNGQWSKGKMNGKGTFNYKHPGRADSVVTGIWEENILKAQKNEPYIIHLKSASVSEVELKRKKTAANNVFINLTSTTAGGTYSGTPDGVNSANWKEIPPPKITDITVITGFYGSLEKDKENTRSTRTILRQVKYPLRLKIEMSDQNLDLEILEEGDWDIFIKLNNNYNPQLNAVPFSE